MSHEIRGGPKQANGLKAGLGIMTVVWVRRWMLQPGAGSPGSPSDNRREIRWWEQVVVVL